VHGPKGRTKTGSHIYKFSVFSQQWRFSQNLAEPRFNQIWYFFDMFVTTFQHLFGIRMHHSAAPDIKKCRHFPGPSASLLFYLSFVRDLTLLCILFFFVDR
jgi:hypothetical protein